MLADNVDDDEDDESDDDDDDEYGGTKVNYKFLG